MNYAFSGGGETLAEHREKGANLEVDVAFQYLQFFLHDDEELARVEREYGAGRMMTGEVKQLLVDQLVVRAARTPPRAHRAARLTRPTHARLQPLVQRHQERRAAVTEETLRKFMEVRRLKF